MSILDYIEKGRGLGLKFLLLFSVIIALFTSIQIKNSGTELVPYAQQIADQMLPIKVENGVIVEPVDTVKTAKIGNELASFELPLVLDTTSDTLDTSNLKQGIYLSRTTLYTVNNNEVRIKKLTGSFELPKADYTDFFNSVLNWTIIIIGIFMIPSMFLIYFLLGLFYSWCAILVAKFASRSYDFDQRMRLSILSLIAAYVIFIPLDMLQIQSRLLFFIAVIAIEAGLIHNMPAQIKETSEAEQQEEKTEEEPEEKE